MFGDRNKVTPYEVFTPRSNSINTRTYAERPDLEDKLNRALMGDKYVIIHGESGNGKTWLYKKVLGENCAQICVINLANMNLGQKIFDIFEEKLGQMGSDVSIKTIREADLGIRPFNSGGGVKHSTEYMPYQRNSFSRLCEELSKFGSKKISPVIILDNFEQIVSDRDKIKEIASIIISADDDVSRYGVKIIIVGTPDNISQMIAKSANVATITNRLIEIPEVARLDLGQARHVMSQGFEKHLNYTILSDKNELYKQISWKTDRIAQQIQELCLKIAVKAEENRGIINNIILDQAEKDWVEETLSADKAVVEMLMNSQETKIGRKNQVLFVLSQFTKEDFKALDVETNLRKTFNESDQTSLNIPQILAGFSTSNNPIIKKNATGGFRFCSPKFRMVIRTMLQIGNDGRLIVKRS